MNPRRRSKPETKRCQQTLSHCPAGEYPSWLGQRPLATGSSLLLSRSAEASARECPLAVLPSAPTTQHALHPEDQSRGKENEHRLSARNHRRRRQSASDLPNKVFGV